MFRIFSWQCWLAVSLTVLLFIVMWVFLRSATCDPTFSCGRNWYDATFELIRIVFDQSTNMDWPTVQRIFLSTCIIFNIIFAGYFKTNKLLRFIFFVFLGIMQGSLFTTFSTTSYYSDINTIDDFLESDLPLLAGLLTIFMDGNRTSALKSRLIRFGRKSNHSQILNMIAHKRNVSWMTRRSNAILDIKTKYESSGARTLTKQLSFADSLVMTECL